MQQVIFTNGRVTIQKSPIGLSVLVDLGDHEEHWILISALTPVQFKQVDRLLDHNPTFPYYDEFYAVAPR